MPGLFEIGQLLTEAQTCVLSNGQAGKHCPAHALHAITAAMATQGYWVQADLLYFLEYTSFQSWAILIYIIAFAGAIFGMGLGAPPRFWLWLVIGPGVFKWLIADTVPMKGVRWNTGPIAGDADGFNVKLAQKEVWKLAEVGLLNTNIVKRGGVTISSNMEPSGGVGTGINGDGSVQVSQLFSYYDALLSDLVDWVISWTGLYSMSPSNASSGGSNIPSASMYADTRKGRGGSIDNQNWLLTNLKWTMLEDITGAKISSPDLRDSFATFFASECGDEFSKGIDEAAFIAAHNSKGLTGPNTIFLRDKPSLVSTVSGGEYGKLTQNLISQSIPTPPSLRKFLDKAGPGSFRESIQFLKSPDGIKASGVLEQIRCDQYLYLLMHALRWEAGHIYYQLVSRLPGGFNPAALHYAMMYGWAVKKNAWVASTTGGTDIETLEEMLAGSSKKVSLNSLESMRFFQNLVLVHLWRNEMAIVPRMQIRRSSGEENVNYVESYQKTVGARSKFGEVYSWAMMVPRLQGVLLYFLAMGYPFCAMLVLIPGWHKIIFTWASFWAWVKIWDIGFALVFVIERSMWAMIGNSPETQRMFSKVLQMDDGIDPISGSHVDILCSKSGGVSAVEGMINALPKGICAPGVVPVVSTSGTMGAIGGATGTVNQAADFFGGGLGDVSAFLSIGQFEKWWNSLRTMDNAMTIGASMKLDLENSYYIYIMSALYFAVPAVTGQLVLGAKAGAASLATGAIGNLAGESGRAAGQGSGGDLSQRARANQAAVGQAAYAKDMRAQAAAGGFAAKAMDQGNAKLMADAQSAYNGAVSGGEGQLSRIKAMGVESAKDALNSRAARVEAGFTVADAGLRSISSGADAASAIRSFGIRGMPEIEGGKGSASASPSAVGATPQGGYAGTGTTPGGQSLETERARNDARGRLANGIVGQGQAANMAAQALFGLGKNQSLYDLAEGNRQQQVGHDSLQAQAGVNQFGFSQQGRGLEVSSGRNSAAADYSAKSAQYDAERNMATSLGGELAAMGAGGALSIGSKPVGMEPMAMTGQLGRGMQSRAEYAGSGFLQFVQSGQSKLQGAYGYEAMSQQYRQGNGDGELKKMPGWATGAGWTVDKALPVGGTEVKPSSPAASPSSFKGIPENASRGRVGV